MRTSLRICALSIRSRPNLTFTYTAWKLMAFADEDGSGTISRVELRGAILKLQEGGAAGKEHAEALERGFDAWLGETVLPRALAAAKKKKLLVAVL